MLSQASAKKEWVMSPKLNSSPFILNRPFIIKDTFIKKAKPIQISQPKNQGNHYYFGKKGTADSLGQNLKKHIT
jgi:hypothetical protein